MKLNIPIEVVFDDLNSMIDELGKLQKYKFGEGDDMTLVDVCDVADILMRHVKAREAKRGTHWTPCSERLPNKGEYVLAMLEYKYAKHMGVMKRVNDYPKGEVWEDDFGYSVCDERVTAWMPLPEPYGGESE